MRSFGSGPRPLVLITVPVLLSACGAKYKPADAVLSGYERSYRFPVERPHENLVYSGRQAGTQAPVVPLLAFGAAWDLDFVVIPKDGDTSMYEFARIAMPSGPQWVALESSAASGDQTLIANLDDIASLMPEIPLARFDSDLVATDKSTEFTVDVAINYTGADGHKVEAVLTGDPPTKTMRHRNGNTFNHSANQLMAVLDVASTQSLFTADVKVDGQNVGFKKIGGFVPAQFVMEQTQGGFATGAFKIVPGEAAAGDADYGKIVVNESGESTVKVNPEMLVKMGVAQNAAQVVKCWKDRDAQQPGLKGGPITFEWTVTNGVSSAAKAKAAPDAFDDSALVGCATAAINAWTFDSSVTGTIAWPFTFTPGDAEADIEATAALGMGESTLVDPATVAPAPAPADAPADGTDGLTDGVDAPAPTAAEDAPIYSFTTVHPGANGASVEMKWLVTRQGDRVTAKQTTSLRTLTYDYRLVQGSYLELYAITVEQYGRATPVTAITFNPPLPDIRWAFSGKRASDFVIDVNGQQSFAYGQAEAYWTEGGPKVKVTGAAPDWVKARPMLATITYAADGTADVKVERVGE